MHIILCFTVVVYLTTTITIYAYNYNVNNYTIGTVLTVCVVWTGKKTGHSIREEGGRAVRPKGNAVTRLTNKSSTRRPRCRGVKGTIPRTRCSWEAVARASTTTCVLTQRSAWCRRHRPAAGRPRTTGLWARLIVTKRPTTTSSTVYRSTSLTVSEIVVCTYATIYLLESID